MANESEINFADLLSAFGLLAEARGEQIIWQRPLDDYQGSPQRRKATKTPKTKKSPELVAGHSVVPNSPWRVAACEIIEKKQRVQLSQLEIALDAERLIARLEAGIRRFFGQRTSGTICVAPDNDRQRTGHAWWCLFEFVRPGAREELRGYTPVGSSGGIPIGSAGFKISLARDGSRIMICVTDHYAFGYVPAEFLTESTKYVAWAFGCGSINEAVIRKDMFRSLFEVSLSPLDAALTSFIKDAESLPGGSKKFWEQYVGVREKMVREFVANGGGFGAIDKSTRRGDSNMADFSVAAIRGEGALRSLLGDYVPMEVLESREGNAQELDLLLLDGNTDKAEKILETALVRFEGSPLYCRRAAALALLSIEWRLRDDVGLDKCHEVEPDSALLLSARLMRCLETGQNIEGLETLSKLGELVTEKIPHGESQPTLDVVLPELLGDLWSGSDREKAAACYRRVLARRGDQPRVLRKLVALCRAEDDFMGEIGWLRRLTAVEQRRNELARICLRLAELQSVYGEVADSPGDTLRCALRAIELDRTLHDAALIVAKQLELEKRFLEAIHFLDRILSETRGAISLRAEARLEFFVGRIWFEALHRQDLALKRLEIAWQLDQDCPELAPTLAAVYRVQKKYEKLAGVLEEQLAKAELQKDNAAIDVIVRELVALWRGPLNNVKRALDLHLRLVSTGGLTPRSIEDLLEWSDQLVDWDYIYNTVLQRIVADQQEPMFSSVDRSTHIGEMYQKLAIIARDKLNDVRKATECYNKALSQGYIDRDGFSLLVQEAMQQGDYDFAVQIYEQRLRSADTEEQATLVREMLGLKAGLTDQKRDQLALKLQDPEFVPYRSPADFGYLLQRLDYYKSHSDAVLNPGLMHFVELVSGLSNVEQRLEVLEQAAEILEQAASDMRFEAVDKVYRLLAAAKDDAIPIYQRACGYLSTGHKAELALPYAQRLLALQVLPRISVERADQVFVGHSRYLAAYYRLLAGSDPEKSPDYLRLAIHELKVSAGADDQAVLESMLSKLCLITVATVAEMMLLRQFVAESGNWQSYADALERQVELTSEQQEKARNLLSLAEVCRVELKDPKRAREVYLKALDVSNRKASIYYALASLAITTNDAANVTAYLKKFLSDMGCLNDQTRVINAIRMLVQYKDQREKIRPIVRPLLEEIRARKMDQLAAQLAEILIAEGFSSSELSESVFAGKIAEGQEQEAATVWIGYVKELTSAKKTREWLERSKAILAANSKEELLPKLAAAVLAPEQGAKLHRRVNREILVFLGLNLFEMPTKRKKACRVLQEAYFADPADQRIWIPLYFAVQEVGSIPQRRRYLKSLIPRLEKDSKVLKSTPLTVESLRAELAEISEGVDDQVVQRGIELDFPGLKSAGDSEKDQSHKVDDEGHGESPAPLSKVAGENFELPFDVDQVGDALSVVKPLPLAAVATMPAPVLEMPTFDFNEAAIPEQDQFAKKDDAPALDLIVTPVEDILPTPAENPSLDIQALPDLPGLPELPQDADAKLFDLGFDQPQVPNQPAGVDVQEIAEIANPTEEVERAVIAIEPLPVESPNTGSEVSLGKFEFELPQVPDLDAATSIVDSNSMGSIEPLMTVPVIETEVLVGTPSESQLPIVPEHEAIDWRSCIKENRATSDTLRTAMGQAFASELEKHVALQLLALCAGACEHLQSWHWRVWRKPDEFGYPPAARDRFPEAATPAGIGGSHHRLISAISPILVRVYSDKFSTSGLAAKLKISNSQLLSARKAQNWNSGVLASAGFGRFAEKLAASRYQAYHLPGLFSEIFYDGRERTFYFDESWYGTKKPPTALFHAIQHQLWAVKFQYFIPLHLDPVSHVMPVVAEVKEILSATGVGKLKSKLGIGVTPVAKAMQNIDTASLKPLIEKSTVNQRDAYVQLWDAMQQHIYKVQIAESLDVIGLFEHITNKDLLNVGALTPGQIYRLSSHIARLIEFCLLLKL